MRQIADLHIHSRFSRACSRDLNLYNLDQTCRKKGVDIIGTGDFTFPTWFEEMFDELEEIKTMSGLYKHKSSEDTKVKFILSTEVALIYKKYDKCRRVHICALAPNLETVSEINTFLDKNYNIRSDGRPILGMSIENFCKICFDINPEIIIYPAHIWTPWFAIFGSKSGFDSWEDAFGEYSDKIYAYETGLSSDPEMNWRISALHKKTMLSNSDAHSLPNIAREANVFEMKKISYDELAKIIRQEKIESYLDYTIEFYPEEGMYHLDGHRDCGVVMKPEETKKHKGICPKCKKKMVVGVDYRVNELADKEIGFKPKGAPGFVKLVELDKIIAEVFGVKSRKSKKVLAEYERMIKNLGPELKILIDLPLKKIKEYAEPQIFEAIKRVKEGDLIVKPGFDGQYGVVKIFNENEKIKQKTLF